MPAPGCSVGSWFLMLNDCLCLHMFAYVCFFRVLSLGTHGRKEAWESPISPSLRIFRLRSSHGLGCLVKHNSNEKKVLTSITSMFHWGHANTSQNPQCQALSATFSVAMNQGDDMFRRYLSFAVPKYDLQCFTLACLSSDVFKWKVFGDGHNIYNFKCLILAVIPLSTGYDVADLFRVTIEKTISLFGWLSGQLHGVTKRQGLSHCVRVYMGLTVASPRWKPKLAVTFRARRIRRIHFRRPPVLTDFKLKFPVEPAPANCHHHCHASKIQKGPISSHWHHHASPPFYLQHIGICLPVNTYFLLYNYNT